jgi:XRE family aerobic/anaerobic benzoate catabolism transcriptional regulator
MLLCLYGFVWDLRSFGSSLQGFRSDFVLFVWYYFGFAWILLLLTEDFGWPFIELSREIEKYAGSNITEIQSLHGANAYRSYETRAI